MVAAVDVLSLVTYKMRIQKEAGQMDRHKVGFAVVGSLMSILFFILVNYLTSPHDSWFIYPTFVLLLWPVSLIFIKQGKYKLHAALGSLLVIVFLVTNNYLYSPVHPWFLYAIFPVIWWPIAVFSGKKATTLAFALIGSMSTILYYALLNVALSPQYPWAIYPAYAVLWWPLALYYARKKHYFGLSVAASVLTIIFLVVVNVVSSPQTIWAIYPIFAILWWPLSMYYYQFKKDVQQAAKKG